MIVDSAHYKDGVRQHEEALTPERAAELRDAAGTGEFVWVGIHEPERGRPGAARRSCSGCTSSPSRTPRRLTSGRRSRTTTRTSSSS